MPVELMAGAALGLGLQVIHEAIIRAKNKSSTTRCILDRLDATVSRITPLVSHVDKLSEEVDGSPRKVIEDFKLILEKVVSLVEGYAELRRRNLLKKYRYKRRIKELEVSLRWMVDVEVQVNQWADIKELIAKMSEMNTKLDEITRPPTDCIRFRSNHNTLAQSNSTNQDIVEETSDRSPKENGECSSDGSKPKIDIHIRWTWSSRKRKNKDHEIRFFLK